VFNSLKKRISKFGRSVRDATQLGVTAVFILSQMVVPFLAVRPVQATGQSPAEECGVLSFLVKYETNERLGTFEDTISEDGGQDVVTFSELVVEEEDDGKKEIKGFEWSSTVPVDKVQVFAGGKSATQTGDELTSGEYFADFIGEAGYDSDKGVSHVTFCYDEVDQVDYCDPSQRPAGMSIGEWLASAQFDGADCFEYEIDQRCGYLDITVTKYPEKDGWAPYSVIYTTDDTVVYPANSFPANFAEDEDGGSVDVTWYIVGPEGDYLKGFGLPNFWDNIGETITVDTDCEDPEPDTVRIRIDKLIDKDGDLNTTDDRTDAPGWEFDIDGPTDVGEVTTGGNGSTTPAEIEPGQYSVTETVQDGYELLHAECVERVSKTELGWQDDNSVVDVDVTDEDVLCTFINDDLKPTKIKVTKYHDIDEDGSWDEEDGEGPVSDWTIRLYDYDWDHVDGDDTDDKGIARFGDYLKPGTYFVCEELVDGWRQVTPAENQNQAVENQSGDGDEADNCWEVYLGRGDTVELKFGNAREVELLIDKVNDTTDAVLPGALVNYTITVTNPRDSGLALDSEVRDVLPDGFIFTGNYSVHSSVRGDITGIVSPDYNNVANLGVWQFDEMVPGEVVTISYEVEIGDGVSPGEYDNVALAEAKQCVAFVQEFTEYLYSELEVQEWVSEGKDIDLECDDKERLFARDVTPETEDDIFAESTVRVGAVLGEEDEEGEVLSVTGAPAILSPAFGGFIALLAGLTTLSKSQIKRLRRLFKKLGRAFLIAGISAAFVLLSYVPAFAIADNKWTLVVSQLNPTTTSHNVTITFSTLSSDTSDDFDVRLDVDGPGSHDQTSGPQSIDHGGGSGSFKVDFPVDGTYELTVTADNIDRAETKTSSQTITVAEDTPTTSTGNGQPADGNGNGGPGALGFGAAGAVDSGGVVSDSAATDDQTAADTEGQEQAATDENADDETDGNGGSTLITIAVLAGLAALLYNYFVRKPNDLSN